MASDRGSTSNFHSAGAMVTDFSIATCTLLFDQRRRTWSDELVEGSGIPPGCSLMPNPPARCWAASQRLGRRTHRPARGDAGRAGRPRPHLWYPSRGSLAAGCCLDPNHGNLGKPDDDSRDAKTLLGFGAIRRLHAGPRGAGKLRGLGRLALGQHLEWFQHECAGGDGGDKSPLMDAARASHPGAGGVVFLPYLSAAVCPRVTTALGGLRRARSTATRGDLCRAVIEGLNYQFLDIAGAMEGGLGTHSSGLSPPVSATRNAFWVQNKADVAGIPVEVSEIQDASSLGAAMIAGVALGLYPSLDEARQRVKQPTRTCTPNLGLTAVRGVLQDLQGSLSRTAPGMPPAVRNVKEGARWA